VVVDVAEVAERAVGIGRCAGTGRVPEAGTAALAGARAGAGIVTAAELGGRVVTAGKNGEDDEDDMARSRVCETAGMAGTVGLPSGFTASMDRLLTAPLCQTCKPISRTFRIGNACTWSVMRLRSSCSS
jgi:hypothetical protein